MATHKIYSATNRTTNIEEFTAALASLSDELHQQQADTLAAGHYDESRAAYAKLEAIRTIMAMAPEGMYRRYLDIKYPPVHD